MLEELGTASEHLFAALERYNSVCNRVRESYTRENTFPKITRQHSRRMDTELATIISYYSMLRRAEQAIGQVRNLSVDLVPVHSLPPELVTRIFYFALAPEPFEPDWGADPKGVGFPKNPDYLSQVCSRWRQIAFATPALWNHLNLALHASKYQGHLPRALSYAARSNQLPLHLHISEAHGTEEYDSALFRFIASIASRTSTLEYHAGGEKCMGLVFKNLFSELTTGVMTTLITNSTSGHLNSFLQTPQTWTELDEHGLNTMSIYLDIPEDCLEALFAPLTVLHLRAISPRWDSLAYHNLVDLRLTSAFRYSWCSIKEENLVSILKASPGLRIFHFALCIKNRSRGIAPVPLEDLEVVNIKTVCTYAKVLKLGSILRLLAPGTRPLRLTIENEVYAEGTSLDETVRFFERSNIARFCAKEGYPPIKRLLPRAPNLQYLVFSSCKYLLRSNLDLPNQAGDRYQFSAAPTLFSWHVRESQMYLGDMLEFVDHYDTRSLSFSNCHMFKPDGQRSLGEDELFEYSQCVSIRSYEGLSPDPTVDWDILD